MNLSEKIKIIRKARGYSQEELGDKVGVSRQTVSDWEKGKFEPTLDSIRWLADVLEVSFDALLDESIDLNKEHDINVTLKNLSADTKEKINNSFRYRIYAYTIKKKDYAFVITYFSILIILMIITIVTSLNTIVNSTTKIILGTITLLILALLPLPIAVISKIKNGGSDNTFGTLSMTHFVIIGWSDSIFDRTIYIPINEIESMELDENAKRKHGKVIVRVKGRNKPIITSEITSPQKLIDVFNNREAFVETPDGK